MSEILVSSVGRMAHRLTSHASHLEGLCCWHASAGLGTIAIAASVTEPCSLCRAGLAAEQTGCYVSEEPRCTVAWKAHPHHVTIPSLGLHLHVQSTFDRLSVHDIAVHNRGIMLTLAGMQLTPEEKRRVDQQWEAMGSDVEVPLEYDDVDEVILPVRMR